MAMCYNVTTMNKIVNKYYTFQPGEFLPIYEDGEFANKTEFHLYRISWILKNRKAAYHQFTHFTG